MLIVPDHSALVAGVVKKVAEKGAEVVIPISVIALLEKEMRENKAEGFVGMREINYLREMDAQGKVSMRFSGTKPRDLRFLSKDEADWDARETARIEGGALLTCDEINARVAEAMGVEVIFIKEEEREKLSIEKFFDRETMSIHIKEGLRVFAKKGTPGKWRFEAITEKRMKREDVEEIAREIVEKAEHNPNAFLEIDKKGATVVQYENYRIVITRPPFSKGIEITAVRPIVKLSLEDYHLPEQLMKRFEERAEGIVIAGAPGAGKTTFAQALAEFYAKKGKIVKTIEHPRDLNVMWEITQYGHLEGDPEATGEVLLLVRPDFTVYDELRTTRDFEVYADMRLAGVGMIGVTHASRAIDAIQRFLRRLDLGVIPQVVDTVIFIEGGKINKVYELEMVVKVPSGMTEADLARPVVEVRDFFTKKVEYEIYAYGEETTIVPVKEVERSPVRELAEREIKRAVRRVAPGAALEVKVVGDKSAVIYADEDSIPHIIGKKGKTIEELEKKLGISISVRSIEELPREERREAEKIKVEFDIGENKNTITFFFDRELAGRQVDFYIDGEYLFSAVVSRKGKVKVGKSTEIGKELVKALNKGKRIEVRV